MTSIEVAVDAMPFGIIETAAGLTVLMRDRRLTGK